MMDETNREQLAQFAASDKKIETIEHNTQSTVEYGERTWTTGQTVRDVMQNHLDANTDRYYEELLGTVCEVDQLEKLTSEQRQDLDRFMYTLFRYRKGYRDFSPETKKQMEGEISWYGISLPLKPGFRNEHGSLDIDHLNIQTETLQEPRPHIRYLVRDRVHGNMPAFWVNLETLQTDRYYESMGTYFGTSDEKPGIEDFRFQAVGIEIRDEGKGFDTALTAFYKSTKAAKRHLRGKYGEGAKMSEIHLIRNGAKVLMRSRYELEGDTEHETPKEREWVVRPYVGTDNKVKLKGIQREQAQSPEGTTGSKTRIDFRNANQVFQEEFRFNIDPRKVNKGGLDKNALEFSDERYVYPTAEPVGVSLNADSRNQYVQGLKVGETTLEGRDYLFSYDFLDSTVLQGRDRNELSNTIENLVAEFWAKADNPELLEALIRRVMCKENIGYPKENGALDRLFAQTHYVVDEAYDRTKGIALELLPRVLGLRQGTNNLFIAPDERSDANASLIHNLESQGWNIVEIKGHISESIINAINEKYRAEFPVFNISNARSWARESGTVFGPESREYARAEKLLYSARRNVELLLASTGLSGHLNLADKPRVVKSIDSGTEKPYEIEFNQALGMFEVTMRPELFGEDKEPNVSYWEQRLEVEVLTTYNRRTKFLNTESSYMHAQSYADRIMEGSFKEGIADFDALPERFNHLPESREYAQEKLEEAINFESELRAIDLLEQSKKFRMTFAECRNLAANIRDLPREYDTQIRYMLFRRYVVEGDAVGYFKNTWDDDGNEIMAFEVVKLSSLTPVDMIDGESVYRVGNALIMPQLFPSESVITTREGVKIVLYGDKALEFREYKENLNSFGEYKYKPEYNELTIDTDAVHVNCSQYQEDISSDLEYLRDGLKKLHVSSPELTSNKHMKFTEGTILTPLPKEYGAGEWDRPERVFEDIVQNHLDASTTGTCDLQYEVVRGETRVWVRAEEMLETDGIVGLAVFDDGDGYAPDNIGTMGNSSKKSPLFAGKYGEGQKLLAAAAARNGVELSFHSHSTYEGVPYEWSAHVGTQEEQIVLEGKKTKTSRVVFNVTSKKNLDTQKLGSSTILRLPDSGQKTSQWEDWVNVIDPRKKDKRGNGGLSRNIINLRKADPENVIDLGYMRILLNEPGAVYENGLFVAKGPEMAFGYDVPDITSGRERNSYKVQSLSTYIGYAIKEVNDPRFASQILEIFKREYVNKANGGQLPYIKHRDLRFDNATLGYSDVFIPTKPLWRMASSHVLPGYVVHSKAALWDIVDNFDKHYGNVLPGDAEADERDQLLVTLSNIDHVPKDRIIEVGQYDYKNFAKLLPTAVEYVQRLSEQEIPASEATIESLRQITVESARILADLFRELQADENSRVILESMLIRKNIDEERSDYAVQRALENLEDKEFSWAEIEQLRDDPDAIFVAPAEAGYLGSANKGRMGINEVLLSPENRKQLVEVIRHELLHKFTSLGDYNPEFISFLIRLAKRNLSLEMV